VRRLPGLLGLAAVCFSALLLAGEQSAVLLFADGFEKMFTGDGLPLYGNDEWVRRDTSTVMVKEDAGQAAEGKRYLHAVAGPEKHSDQTCAYLKIDRGAAEGAIHRSLAALGLGPEQLQGQRLHFRVKARGKGYVHFYLYRYTANGGGVRDGSNPYSPITQVSTNWNAIEWTYLVPAEPEAAEYHVAIHFFTYDDRGIDLDDFKLESDSPKVSQ
jgi:hypothetical protein